MKSRYISIRRKLLSIVLVLSTIITSIVFSLSIFIDYKQEKRHYSNVSLNIEKTILGPLSRSMWNFNRAQADEQLKSLLNLSEVTDVKLEWLDLKNGNIVNSESKYSKQNDVTNNNPNWQKFEVVYIENQDKNILGYLYFRLDEDGILERIFKRSSIYLLLQAVKTFVLSFVLLFIFQAVVTGRIEDIVRQIKQIKLDSVKTRKKIKLKGSLKSFDELNSLVRTINQLTFRTAKYNETLQIKVKLTEEQIEIERAKSIESSKLASLGEMASGIAHEINNPLAIILSKAQTLRMKLDKSEISKEKLQDEFDKIATTAHRISKIIKGLKTLSRNASSDPFEVVNLQQIIDDVLGVCSAQLKLKEIDLKIEGASEIYFSCRPTQIAQVLINLISNSKDALENLSEKWILIQVHKYEDNFKIYFKDSGQGIPLDVVQKIMQPFFTTKPVGKGTGLGLSISLSILKEHEGNLEVNQKSKNTEFVITLPYRVNQTKSMNESSKSAA